MSTLLTSVLSCGSITVTAFLACTLTALLSGLIIAFVFRRIGQSSPSLAVTLAILPILVEVIIMLVNGNIGAGVAVAGAFSLVRFRSAQGSAQEILAIFLAMTAGLAAGMGYLVLALPGTLVVMALWYLFAKSGLCRENSGERLLKITVPENLDYEGVFDDIFARYTTQSVLEEVRTSGMGSLFKLSYTIRFRDGVSTKAMLDEIRQRNGNLEISCSRPVKLQVGEL